MARQTSIIAYRKIKDNGLLSNLRFLVYDLVFRHGPITANQLIQVVDKVHNTGSILTRLSELRELGVIKEVNQNFICPVSGNKVILWDVTDGLPIKVEPRISNKERIRLLERENHLLKEEIARLKALDSTVFEVNMNENQVYFPFGR